MVNEYTGGFGGHGYGWATNGSAGGGGGLTSPVGISDGGTGQTSQTAAFDALSPNTTGGDITYHNGTNNVRLAVGKDETRLGITSGSPSYLYPSVEPSIWLPLRVYGGFIVNRPNSGNATQSLGTQASFSIGGMATAATDTDGMFVKATTAATTNSDALCTSNAGVIRRDTAPRVWCHFKTGASISVCRIWIGLMNADLSAITSPTTADVAALRYDTSAGDTTLKLVTCNAGGTATVTDTGITPAILTDYSVCFDLLDTSKLNVYICVGGAVATKVGPVSATLPRSGAVDLNTTLSIRTLENVAKEIRFGSFVWTQKG